MPPPQDLAGRLDTLIRLTAMQVLGDRTGNDAIVLLAHAGLDNELIGELVGTSPATVRATLSRARRSKTRR